jgi:hypothetical protein
MSYLITNNPATENIKQKREMFMCSTKIWELQNLQQSVQSTQCKNYCEEKGYTDILGSSLQEPPEAKRSKSYNMH